MPSTNKISTYSEHVARSFDIHVHPATRAVITSLSSRSSFCARRERSSPPLAASGVGYGAVTQGPPGCPVGPRTYSPSSWRSGPLHRPPPTSPTPGSSLSLCVCENLSRESWAGSGSTGRIPATQARVWTLPGSVGHRPRSTDRLSHRGLEPGPDPTAGAPGEPAPEPLCPPRPVRLHGSRGVSKRGRACRQV